jgi:hypothetical protein
LYIPCALAKPWAVTLSKPMPGITIRMRCLRSVLLLGWGWPGTWEMNGDSLIRWRQSWSAFFVLKVGWDVLRDSFNELMEKSLGPDVHRQITTVADGIAGLSNPHSIKTRKIGQDIAIEMHIDVDVNTTVGNAHALTEILEDHLKEAFGESTFISIHVEPKI